MTGDELKNIRALINLTIEKSAEQVGVSERTWYRYEAGETAIPAATAKLYRMLNAKRITAAEKKGRKGATVSRPNKQ